jgi:putative cell wall-binding protein
MLGLSVLGLSTTASALPVTVSGTSIVASSAPNITPNGVNQTAGNLVVTLAAGYTTAAPDAFTITVKDSAGNSNVTWDHNPTLTVVSGSGDVALCAGGVSGGCTVTGANTGVTNGITLTINLTGTGQLTGAPAASTITLSNIGFTTGSKNPTATPAAAGGPVTITTNLSPATVGLAASNAVVTTVAIASLVADTTPTINPGGTSTAGTWELYLSGANNSWTSGDKIYVTIARNDGTNCETVGYPDTVGFSAAPTVLVSAAQNGATTIPTLTASLAEATGSSCVTASGVDNELVLTFTNSGTISTGTLPNGAAIDITLYQPKLVTSADTYTYTSTVAGGCFTNGQCYTTAPPNASGTNLGPIDVLMGYNTLPTFGSSTRIAAASVPGTVTATSGTPAGVPNDELIGGSELGIGAPPIGDVLVGSGAAYGVAGATIINTACPVTSPQAFDTLEVPAVPSTLLAGTQLQLGTPGSATQIVTVAATKAPSAVATTISVSCFVPNSTAYEVNLTPIAGPSVANINSTAVTVTANSPSVTLQYNATSQGGESVNNPISPIVITEGTAGALGGGVNGYACITLTQAPHPIVEWNSASTPMATASGGGLAVGPVNLLTPGGQSGPTILEFQVTTPSSGTPGTITISGLNVNVPETPGLTLTASLMYQSNGPACTTGAVKGYANNPFTLAYVASRTFGSDMDATAAQEFGNDVNGGAGCRTSQSMVITTGPGLTTTNAILVTDQGFQDALSATYMAGNIFNSSIPDFGTGILTTPTNTLSASALQAIRLAGVTDVYVVGGPLAVSQADVSQLESTPVYTCAGAPLMGLAGPIDLAVHWIYGPDADGTAEAVATYFGPQLHSAAEPGLGAADFPGAFAGQYNDTTGSNGSGATTAADSPVSTAILATDTTFQDAASASPVAASAHFPIVLTGQASLSAEAAAALENDSVQQVLALGGPDVISDNVLSQVEALGIQVLRIAGQDYTDTSQLLAQFELDSVNLAGQAVGLDWDDPIPGQFVPPRPIGAARGDFYTDALTAGPLIGAAPLLLTWNTSTTGNPAGTDYLSTFLHQIGQVGYDEIGRDVNAQGNFLTLNNVSFIGGPLAMSQTLENTFLTDLSG